MKNWCAVVLMAVVATAADPLADAVAQALDLARDAAGVPALERRPALDRVAERRATELAALPHHKRMGRRRPLSELLEAEGVERYSRAGEHIDLQRGHADPARSFVETWRAYENAWESVMDPAQDAIGIAAVEGEDGFLVLVAVTVRDVRVRRDLGSLARRTVDEVNRVRAEHGSPELRSHARLARVARKHSEEMAHLDFFDHESPNTGDAARRVRTAGIRFRRLAENLQTNNDADDPVASAVESWLDSPGHRANMLDADFSHTGVGIAVDEDGDYYFTQLFMLADE